MRSAIAVLLGLAALPATFRWTAGPPLIAPLDRGGDHYHSIKDPSVVRYNGRWHLFCTVRGVKRSHQIEYLSFPDWDQAAQADRRMLHVTDGYFCAPQVFYFRPHKKWYLIYQATDPSRQPALQPAFSTTSDLAAPDSWTRPVFLFPSGPEGVKAWIDFWVICDERRAYLFFTSLDGRMWRSDAAIADFPHGWTRPQVVLAGDIYEASHTYRVKGKKQFLTVVEAQGQNGRRYYKAYVTERLDGEWKALAATSPDAFAHPGNVIFPAGRWSDSFSHGELLRDGYDETLTVNPSALTFLFQGVADADRTGKVYGEIPWRLGLLRMRP